MKLKRGHQRHRKEIVFGKRLRPLTVMPSNNTGSKVRALADRFPGRVANLIAPGGWRNAPPGMAYALDNGAFGCWTAGKPFDSEAFYAFLDRVATGPGPAPLWVAVPDVVADRKGTLSSWEEHAPRVARYGWPLAFVVQDGMRRQDVPLAADLVFVGGTLAWKWAHVPAWAAWFKRVHVGRVNSPEKLWQLESLGVESCDGTGWLRGDQFQWNGLVDFLAGKDRPRFLFADDDPALARWKDLDAIAQGNDD